MVVQLLGGLSVLLVLVTSLGVIGLTSFSVTQRTVRSAPAGPGCHARGDPPVLPGRELAGDDRGSDPGVVLTLAQLRSCPLGGGRPHRLDPGDRRRAGPLAGGPGRRLVAALRGTRWHRSWRHARSEGDGRRPARGGRGDLCQNEAMGGRLKVLIVDDEPAVARALGVLFDLHGISHASAAAPEEALGRLEDDDVGVVIQDMNFGADKTSGEDGIRLFRRIRAVDPEMPILLVTAWASLETAVQLVKERASDYLAKPWDDEKLLVTVNNLLKMRHLQLENRRLQHKGRAAREALAAGHDLRGLVYESDAMHRLVVLAVSVGASNAPVLVTGPSGLGGRSWPRSSRPARPVVPVRSYGSTWVPCPGSSWRPSFRAQAWSLHWCPGPWGRAVRGGGPGDALPRRDRRPFARRAGEAPSGPSERGVPTPGQQRDGGRRTARIISASNVRLENSVAEVCATPTTA